MTYCAYIGQLMAIFINNTTNKCVIYVNIHHGLQAQNQLDGLMYNRRGIMAMVSIHCASNWKDELLCLCSWFMAMEVYIEIVISKIIMKPIKFFHWNLLSVRIRKEC